MNPEAGLKFFVVAGVILMLAGGLLFLMRPRRSGEVGLARWLNRGTVWALFCVLIGILAVLIGTGVLPMGRVSL